MVDVAEDKPSWGRVLICGGLQWNQNGKKSSKNDVHTEERHLLSPWILRSLSNVKATKAITGPSANYAMVLDVHGNAYMFGKPPATSLATTPEGTISEQKPLRISPSAVGLPKGITFVGGAAARGHALLVDSRGGVWGVGNNVVGQLGMPVRQEVGQWTKVPAPWAAEPETHIIQVSAGHMFSLYLTNTGQVWASGSSESGQLGNGKSGERLLKAGKVSYDLEIPARRVQGLDGVRIVQIASGNQHSLALDEEGHVYAWGNAGYARLGLQDQKDRYTPTLVAQFAGRNDQSKAKAVYCGPSNSVIVNRLGMYHMAGRWKLTGDGSHGQPYTTFKTIQDIMGCKVMTAASGGCSHFLTTPTDTGATMTVGFGQGCLYGELGLGENEGKSTTRPIEIEPLRGVDVVDVGAGAFTTLFIARPNDALSELQRWPAIMSDTTCLVCGRYPASTEEETNETNGGVALECEKCEAPYHLKCLDPPLDDVPDGEWFCVNCEREEAEDQVGVPLGGVDTENNDEAATAAAAGDEADDGPVDEAGTDVPDEPEAKKGRGSSRGPSKSATPRRSETPVKTLKRKPTSGSLNGSAKKAR